MKADTMWKIVRKGLDREDVPRLAQALLEEAWRNGESIVENEQLLQDAGYHNHPMFRTFK